MSNDARFRAGLAAYANATVSSQGRRYRAAPSSQQRANDDGSSFENFSASELYCPKCKRAMPVREKLLLVLLDGSLYNYLCSGCGEVLGERRT